MLGPVYMSRHQSGRSACLHRNNFGLKVLLCTSPLPLNPPPELTRRRSLAVRTVASHQLWRREKEAPSLTPTYPQMRINLTEGPHLPQTSLWTFIICHITGTDWALGESKHGALTFVKPMVLGLVAGGCEGGNRQPQACLFFSLNTPVPVWMQVTEHAFLGMLEIEAICGLFNLPLERPIHNSNGAALNYTVQASNWVEMERFGSFQENP